MKNIKIEFILLFLAFVMTCFSVFIFIFLSNDKS